MAPTHPLQGHPDAAQLRKDAGRVLRKMREEAGLTQQEMAKQLGLDYYTLISQIELGKTGIPQDKLEDWATVLGQEPPRFALQMMQFYAPSYWRLVVKLFGQKS